MGKQLKSECYSHDAMCDDTVPLAEGVQAGQNFRIVVVLQTNAADQELLVYLSHHRAGAARLPLSHGERHSREEYEAHTPLSLQKHREKGRWGGTQGERQTDRGIPVQINSDSLVNLVHRETFSKYIYYKYVQLQVNRCICRKIWADVGDGS